MKYIIPTIFSAILVCFYAYDAYQQNTSRTVTISGHFEKDNKPDTIYLTWWGQFYSEHRRNSVPHTKMKSVLKNGEFSFMIDSPPDRPFYFSLTTKEAGYEKPILNYFLARSGDNVRMTISDSAIEFGGNGAAKYNCLYKLKRQGEMVNRYFRARRGILDSTTFLKFYSFMFDEYDSAANIQIDILNQHRNNMEPSIYNLIYADVIGDNRYWKSFIYLQSSVLTINRLFPSESSKASARQSFLKLYLDRVNAISGPALSDNVLANSKNFIRFLHIQARIESKRNDLSESYYLIVGHKGLLRDKLLVYYFLEQYENINNADELIKGALTIVEDDRCRDMLNRIIAREGKGSKAFNFSLPDTEGKLVKMEDLKGKVVLLDFWFTGCSGCIHYNKVLSGVKKKFINNQDVVFVSISIDSNKEKWLRSVNGGKYTSPEAINLYTEGKGREHPVIRYYNIVGYPKPLLIDKKGNIFSSSAELREQQSLERLINEALVAN